MSRISSKENKKMKIFFIVLLFISSLNVYSQQQNEYPPIDESDCNIIKDTAIVEIKYLYIGYKGKNYYSQKDSIRFLFTEDWITCPLITKGIINGVLLNEIGFSLIDCEYLKMGGYPRKVGQILNIQLFPTCCFYCQRQ